MPHYILENVKFSTIVRHAKKRESSAFIKGKEHPVEAIHRKALPVDTLDKNLKSAMINMFKEL